MRALFKPLPIISAMVLATPAMAQDRETHFDGLYLGGSVGIAATAGSNNPAPVQFDTDRDGSYGDTVRTSSGADAFSPGFCPGVASGTTSSNCAGDRDDIEYSVRIGYDKRIGSLVVGGLVELAKPEATDAASAFSTTPAGYHFARQVDYAASARMRLGYTPNGGALFYVTGGGSYAKIGREDNTTNTANSFTSTNEDAKVWGWQAGGGAEIMISGGLSLGLECVYNRYDDKKYFVAVWPGTASPTNPFLLNGGGTNMRQDPRFEFHALRATVNLRF